MIKVERLDGGDFARGYDHVVHGTGAHFVWLNRGKESIAVDLKSAEGCSIVRRLIDRADVFVQNLAPGAADRLGLGADELRSQRPELITVGISGFGAGGQFEQRKAYDMLIQAEAGLIAITGTPDHPVKTGIPTADIAAGMYAAQAVLAALLRRMRTGEGATIEVSMLDATVEWMGHALYTQMYTGGQPPRMGLSHTAIAPYDAYPTSDGQMLIGVQNDNGWRALVTDVLDAPELAHDPRFATNVERVQNRVAVRRCGRRPDTALVHSRTRCAVGSRGDSRRPGQEPRPGGGPSTTTGAESLAHHRNRERQRPRAAAAGNFLRHRTCRWVTYPHWVQHTLRLLLESGLDATAANDALVRGVARQADTEQLAPTH